MRDRASWSQVFHYWVVKPLWKMEEDDRIVMFYTVDQKVSNSFDTAKET